MEHYTYSKPKMLNTGLKRSIATDKRCGCEWVCDLNGYLAAEYRLCAEHYAKSGLPASFAKGN